MGYIGTSVNRNEDPPLLRGTATFVADIRRPAMLHAAVVRSTQAHARIVNIDTSAALTQPGVIGVWAYRDIGPLPVIPIRLAPSEALTRALQRPLADEVTRYMGEPIAVVVAETRYEAEDAREAVLVEYEPLQPVVEAEAARSPGTALLYENIPDNVADRIAFTIGDVAGAFSVADHIVEAEFSIQRHTGSPLETRGLVAEYDGTTEALTVWGPTKVVHFNRGVLAQMLGLDESRIRFIEPSVGGGFGIRGEFYPEDYLIPLLAMRLRRPVSWIEDRSEHLQAANHSRQQTHRVRAAVRNDGRILAIDDTVLADMGAYVRTHGATVPKLTLAYLPGPYDIPNYSCEALCVLTNKTPTGTYRAPGRFEAGFVRERLMDMVAHRLELSPVEVRRINFIQPEAMPFETGTLYGDHRTVYDSGDYPRQLTEALDHFGYDQTRAWCDAARADGRYVGIGIGCIVEKSGMGPWEYSRVEVELSGGVVVYSGGASVGQGIDTALAQIVADQLSVRFEDVRVVHGDTAKVPYGMGSFAQRATMMAGNAANIAAEKVRDKILKVAASLLEADPDDLVIEEGRISVQGSPTVSLSLAEVARACRPLEALSRGIEPGLVEEAYFFNDEPANPYGVHLALIEIDADTGRITILRYMVVCDVGVVINPKLVEGQIAGGVAQGIGGALYEELAYDAEGQLVASSFIDYLLPTSMEIPHIEVVVTSDYPSPRNPLRVKGAGEVGTPGVGAALANAVSDALGTSDGPVSLPLSPERVQRLVRPATERSGRVATSR